MPYSNRYIMEQMARGRPAPQGNPEPHLHAALERVDAMEIERAIHMGARVDVPDARGRSSAHILLDAAITHDGAYRQDPRRFLACVRALVRENANFNLPHPATRITAVGRMACLATTPIGRELHALIRPRVRWEIPVQQGGPTAKQAWDEALQPAHPDGPHPPSAPRPRAR